MTEHAELAVVDFLTHNKVTIRAKPAAIWPHLVDLKAWRTNQILAPVSGGPDEVGARFLAASITDPDTPLFHVENAEMVPEQRRTIRLAGIDGGFIGFATWELTPMGDETVLAYDVYCRAAMLPPGMSQAEMTAMSWRVMDEGLKTLKAVVEG